MRKIKNWELFLEALNNEVLDRYTPESLKRALDMLKHRNIDPNSPEAFDVYTMSIGLSGAKKVLGLSEIPKESTMYNRQTTVEDEEDEDVVLDRYTPESLKRALDMLKHRNIDPNSPEAFDVYTMSIGLSGAKKVLGLSEIPKESTMYK